MNNLKKALFIGGLAGVIFTDALVLSGSFKADKFLREQCTILKPGEDPDKVTLYYHINDKGFQESQVIMLCDTDTEYYKEVIKGVSKYYIPATVTGAASFASLIASQIVKGDVYVNNGTGQK